MLRATIAHGMRHPNGHARRVLEAELEDAALTSRELFIQGWRMSADSKMCDSG